MGKMKDAVCVECDRKFSISVFSNPQLCTCSDRCRAVRTERQRKVYAEERERRAAEGRRSSRSSLFVLHNKHRMNGDPRTWQRSVFLRYMRIAEVTAVCGDDENEADGEAMERLAKKLNELSNRKSRPWFVQDFGHSQYGDYVYISTFLDEYYHPEVVSGTSERLCSVWIIGKFMKHARKVNGRFVEVPDDDEIYAGKPTKHLPFRFVWEGLCVVCEKVTDRAGRPVKNVTCSLECAEKLREERREDRKQKDKDLRVKIRALREMGIL